MLRSVYLLGCRTCVNLKDVVIYRKFNTLCNESFQSRTLKYLKSRTTLQEPWPDTSEISNECSNNLLPRAQKMLESIYSDFRNAQSTTDQVLRNRLLEDIDTKCFSIVDMLKPNQIFDLLYNILLAYPHRIQTTYFYEKAISYLVASVNDRLLNTQEIVQLLHYMSVNKDIARGYIDYIRPLLTDIKELSLLEKCVVADCYVKLKLQFTQAESEEFERIIEDHFELLKKDPNMLIIVCKALISISAKEALTLKKLTNAIISATEPWDFKILVNVLSLYSKALLFEPKVIDVLVKNGIAAMKKDLDTHQLELIDISKFLGSLSNLGLTLTLDEKLILRITVEKRFDEYKQPKNISFLVSAVLFLHILRCWSTKVLNKCFSESSFEPVYHNKFLWKVQRRLKLLLTQVNLEMKMKTPKSLDKPIIFGCSPSMNVNELEQICQKLIHKNIVSLVKIECPIQPLHIPGVTLKAKNTLYHIDVLDNTTCLKNTNVPHGYMNLKLRLLSRLQMRQILIRENLLRDPQAVEKYIVDKINHGRASAFHQMW